MREEATVALVLAGDVGGTKTLLALVDPSAENVQTARETSYPSASYPGLAPIVREFLKDVQEPVGTACFGVPGPVLNGECRTPNLPWFLTERDLERDTELEHVRLINDFAAAAMGVLALPDESFCALQEGVPERNGTIAVVGAGTGIGEAFLFWDGRRYRANPTEGGHAGFAPQGELQRELLAYLERSYHPVSVERAVSGPGLLRIYRFLVERGVSSWPEVSREIAREDPGEVIARHALARSDLACEQALDLFVACYAAEAANMALRGMATGGVYVAGGIAPKIVGKLREGAFLATFRDKGRMSELMRRVPLFVVLEPRAGLFGAGLEAGHLLSERVG
jgi:glucokinase